MMSAKLTADIEDAYRDSGRIRSCETQFRQFGGRREFSGRIRTVKVFEDNALVRATLGEAGHGNVLVVDGGGSVRAALIGDTIGAMALANDWAGIIVFGAVRDVALLGHIAIGVKALGTNPWKSGKTGAGFVDVEVLIGNVAFTPGAYLYSDDDGIVVSDAELS